MDSSQAPDGSLVRAGGRRPGTPFLQLERDRTLLCFGSPSLGCAFVGDALLLTKIKRGTWSTIDHSFFYS